MHSCTTVYSSVYCGCTLSLFSSLSWMKIKLTDTRPITENAQLAQRQNAHK